MEESFYSYEPQTRGPDESGLTFELQTSSSFELLKMFKYYFILSLKIV